ncbi:MAG: VOC family protein [Leptospiraceae bacterium]|nr:VOC family protein [Leptospiraceae bacterium]MCP5512925.1 VOC family protein [Leptospiraceae bacterium]
MIIVEGIDHLNLAVTDLQKSVAFYSEIFDFEIEDDAHRGYVVMTLDPIKIKLVKVDKVENPLSALNIPQFSFVMDVDDFTEAITEFEAKGIEIVKGPETTENGGETLLFKDPDNNLIEIFYTN